MKKKIRKDVYSNERKSNQDATYKDHILNLALIILENKVLEIGGKIQIDNSNSKFIYPVI